MKRAEGKGEEIGRGTIQAEFPAKISEVKVRGIVIVYVEDSEWQNWIRNVLEMFDVCE